MAMRYCRRGELCVILSMTTISAERIPTDHLMRCEQRQDWQSCHAAIGNLPRAHLEHGPNARHSRRTCA